MTINPPKKRSKNAGSKVSADNNETPKEVTMSDKKKFSTAGRHMMELTRGAYIARLEMTRNDLMKALRIIKETKESMHSVEETVPDYVDHEMDAMIKQLKEAIGQIDEHQLFFLESWENYRIGVSSHNELAKKLIDKAADRHRLIVEAPVLAEDVFEKDDYEDATYSVDGKEMSKEDTEAMKKLTREV